MPSGDRPDGVRSEGGSERKLPQPAFLITIFFKRGRCDGKKPKTAKLLANFGKFNFFITQKAPRNGPLLLGSHWLLKFSFNFFSVIFCSLHVEEKTGTKMKKKMRSWMAPWTLAAAPTAQPPTCKSGTNPVVRAHKMPRHAGNMQMPPARSLAVYT